jgi:hypothetical protein
MCHIYMRFANNTLTENKKKTYLFIPVILLDEAEQWEFYVYEIIPVCKVTHTTNEPQ